MDQASNTAVTAQRTKRIVVRNVLFLVFAQLVGTPLSLLVNAVMARHLGPGDFGLLYLASTFSSFGFLAVDWGQSGTLPSLVAKDHARAGELLGSGIVWRAIAALAAFAVLSLGSHALGYSSEFQVVLAFIVLTSTINTIGAACQDVIRGFERTDVSAYAAIGGQLSSALIVVPTLLLGGRLRAVLLGFTGSAAIVLAYVWRTAKPVIGRLSFRRETLKKLLADGFPFLFLGLAMVLQPNIDGIFLSKLAPSDTVGWYAAARKLVGVVIFPATALMSALYPTLCRLHAEDMDGFRRTTSAALRLITIIVVPVTVACAIYPETGIRIFSKDSFAPAADDLRVLSAFVMLLYFTMTMGISLVAAGRQRAWAATQLGCVAVSLIFDPLLVPWFQNRTGNGGIGLCVTSVASEVLMLGAGIWLMPRGVFDRALFRELLLTVLAGTAMVGAARLMSSLSPFVAGPLALFVYVGVLFSTGGLDKEQLGTLASVLRRKFARS